MTTPTHPADHLAAAGAAMRPFSASLPMALLRAREAAMRVFRPLLAAHDLTEQQWRVLRALSSGDEPVDAGQLAEQTVLLPPSLSRILAHLDARGLIVRRADPSDQRRTLIILSEAGRSTVAGIAPQSERRYEAIEEQFGAERLAHLLAELAELADLHVGPHDVQATSTPMGTRSRR